MDELLSREFNELSVQLILVAVRVVVALAIVNTDSRGWELYAELFVILNTCPPTMRSKSDNVVLAVITCLLL